MDLSTFDFEEHPVRAFQDDQGNAWFVGVDITDALGLENSSQAIGRLDDDERLTYTLHISGQNREVLTINESGLYSLILTSRKPEAKRFKKWVTSEVLPSIRKTGAYSMPKAAAAQGGEGLASMASVMQLIAGQRMPMVDAALAVTVLAKSAHDLTGVPMKDAFSDALHDFGEQTGFSAVALQSGLGGDGKTKSATAAWKAWGHRLRWRNERERQQRRLNIRDLLKDASEVDYQLDGVSLSEDDGAILRDWSRQPAHVRCLRVLWAYELRAQAVVVWWMMEQHRRLGGLGQVYAVPCSAQDIYDVVGEMFGASLTRISAEMKRALDQGLLCTQAQVPNTIRALWLNVPEVLQHLRGMQYPANEDILLLHALLGDRAEAVVMDHLLYASHHPDRQRQSHQVQGAMVEINCTSLTRTYGALGVQVGERRVRRAVERLVIKGYAVRDSGIDAARCLGLGGQLKALQGAMDAFYEVFGLQLEGSDSPAQDAVARPMDAVSVGERQVDVVYGQ